MATFQVQAPEKFNFSKPETWHKWIQRFDRFRSASGLDEKNGATQVNSLIYSMGPEADEIFASFDLSEDNKKKYAKVKEQFDNHFIVRKNVIFERAKFNKRKQEEGETVDSFVTSLYTLSEHCGYNDLREEMIRDRIVVGIKDSNLSLKMQLDADLTLKKATDMARQSESVKKQQAIMRNDNTDSTVDSVKAKGNKQKFKRVKPKVPSQYQGRGCQRCGQRQMHPRDKCPARGAKCFKCSNVGHFAKCCKTAKSVGSVTVDSDSEDGFLGTIDSNKPDAWTTNIPIRNKNLNWKIDTGADVSVISDADFNGLTGTKLVKSDRKLSGPGNSDLHVVGKFQCMLETQDKFSVQDIYVVKGLSKPLLGRPAIQALGIIERVNVSSVNATAKTKSYYRAKFPKIFSGLGRTNWTYKIALDPNTKPYALSTPRRVPLPLMEKVKKEVERMEKLGVISKMDEPTEWCAGMVVVPKSNSDDVRICIDFTRLNESVKRENFPLPSVEESLAKLSGAKIFTKLDANSSFWQTNLAPESRPLTTFITPYGRYCCNRLPFGINSASEFFQKRMSETLEGLPGVLCHMDDVLIFGSSQEEHDQRLEKALSAIGKAGLTLNDKCEFSKDSVKFLGQIIDSSGCRVDPDKIKAIVEMERPTDISGIRRFLGMVNQLNKFSPRVTELTKPLRELLKAKNDWSWDMVQEQAFNDIKLELASSGTLGHYDPNAETVVSADASSFGVGAIIRQKQKGLLKPVAYASRSMSETEKRYAQIEKEALAITWACEKFSNYLIGKKFHLETDHKPLVPLLSTKDIAELPPRIQRFRMRLMRFDFSIKHVAGKDLNIADTLSRAPVGNMSESDKKFETETKAFVDAIVSSFPASTNKLERIKNECAKDVICNNIIYYCKNGWPEKSSLKENLRPYWNMRGDFTVSDNLLLKGTRLVIPQSLQADILARLHDGHQGISKCRQRAKSTVWWLGVGKQLENVVKTCQKCLEQTNDQAEPLMQTEFPKRPWQRLASDLFEIEGQSYLLVIDYFSRYIEIAKLFSTSSISVINHLKSIFARHGIPEYFVSDGGPQYTSIEFKKFAQSYGFQHIVSSPRYPQSNGLAERGVQSVKKMLKKSDDPYLALLSYRTTPLANGYSPAELLMGRKLQSLVPISPINLKPKWPNLRSVRENENESKLKQVLLR